MALPRQKPLYERLFFHIKDASKIFGVNASLLRYYESEFEILQPKKNKRGTRYFTQEDMKNLKLIFYYINEKGYTIEGAKAKMKENVNEGYERMEMVESLKKVREFLILIKEEADERSKDLQESEKVAENK